MFIESFPEWLIDLFNESPDDPGHPYSRQIAANEWYLTNAPHNHTFEYAE